MLAVLPQDYTLFSALADEVVWFFRVDIVEERVGVGFSFWLHNSS